MNQTYLKYFHNAFSYDAMGNILTQVRHNRAGTKIEDMKYKYQYLDPTTKTKLQRNRLYHIYEPLSLSSLDATDIDNMGAYDSTAVNINVSNNYVYDEEGRLVKDKAEKISKIVWRVDGKVKEIQRLTGTTKWLKFDYDAMGHRIAKHVYNNTGTTLERSTYYVLDAQGNQISMYDHEVVGGTAQYNLKERNIFGSSRIGSKQDSMNVLTATITQNYTQILGTKYYEFSNHLGNVLTVFSDVKIALDANSNGIVDGYRAPIRNTADYSPFGVQLDGRTIQGDFYRYGYQGSEKDDESKGGGNSYTTFFRQLDPRVGRWFSIDPKPEAAVSLYSSMDNNPILYKDILGNYTEKRAERMAKRAKSNGYDATVKHNEGAGKNDYGVAYHKRNESNTGSYMSTQYSGKFRGIGEEGLIMDHEVKFDKIIETNDLIGMSTLISTESIILHVAPKFKSNTSNISFSKLKTNQQNWRVMAEMGKSGKLLFRVSKCLGTASTIAAPILTAADMYNKKHDDDPKTNIETGDQVDLGVGLFGAAGAGAAYVGIISNPVGWGIGIASGVYFIGKSVYDLDLQIPSNTIIDSPIPNQNKQKIQG